MRVNYKQKKSAQEAFHVASDFLKSGVLKNYGVDPKIHADSEKYILSAEEKGLDLKLKFYTDYLELEMKLPLLLRPLKSKIEGVIEKELSKIV